MTGAFADSALDRTNAADVQGPWSTVDLYLLACFLLVVLVLQQWVTLGVTSDGCLYFAHLRSLVFDHDLQIGPELDVLRLPPRPHHVVPIGPAILWAPLYLVVAAGDWAGSAIGAWTREEGVALGLTGPYVRAAFFMSFAAAASGIVALHLRLRREFGGGVALLTSILMLGATTLGWYVVFEPSMTHAASFGAVGVALVATERWLAARAPTRSEARALGALFALAVVIRPEDGLFLLFPLAALLVAAPYAGTPPIRRVKIAADMLVGAVPFVVLQTVMVAVLMSDSTFKLAGGDEGYLSLADARLVDVLFSSRHGLFSWTPVVWVGLVGTACYARRRAVWAVPALLAFVLLVWINGSAHDWAGGWAFGGRRFTSVLAAFAPGFALAIEVARRRPNLVLVPLVALMVGWNGLLMTQFQRGLIPPDETIRFDTLVRQQTELYLKPPYFYPFAFPANVWFAWRERLPVDRYDLLGSEPLRRVFYLPLNDWGARFLLDGWQNGAGDQFGSRHVLSAPIGTIVVPLDVPADQAFSLDIEARAEGAAGTAPIVADVAVNGRTLGDLRLDASAPATTRRVFVVPPGLGIWRRGYNRVTISRPNVAPSPPAVPPAALVVYALRLGPAPAAPGR